MKTGWKQGDFILDQVFIFGMTSYKIHIKYHISLGWAFLCICKVSLLKPGLNLNLAVERSFFIYCRDSKRRF
jgi:hypothetical protein